MLASRQAARQGASPNFLSENTPMKKILMGLTALLATSFAVPAFAEDAPKAEGAKAEKPAKKKGKKAKKAEGEKPAEAPAAK